MVYIFLIIMLALYVDNRVRIKNIYKVLIKTSELMDSELERLHRVVLDEMDTRELTEKE